MSQRAEIWQCPVCAARVDVTDLGFYAEIVCQQCGHTDHVHTLLANFRLEGVLGVGGMSIVLRGKDVVLGRPVAIKLLNETYRNQPERIARFENECSMMAKVRHENVVAVYSAGWAKDQFYIAMELLEGRNLETIVTEKGPLSPLRAIEVITHVVKGLEAAHIAGMLHRDMKPGNVIITEAGIPKVLDFGLAQGRTEDEDSEEVIWATPYYVAPETLQRNAEDARTDIYSVGMTLRYLLTGTDSLPGNPASVSALLDAKYNLEPFNRQMPKAEECLCELIDHMTAFAPEERHDNYADVLAELKEVQDVLNEKHLDKVSPRKRLIRQRNRALIGAGIAVAAAGAFAIGYFAGTPAAERYVIPEPTNTELFSVNRKSEVSVILTHLKKSRFDQALKSAKELDNDKTEPTMAAWGLLHGAGVAYLTQKGADEVDAYLDAFKRVISKKQYNPAGSELHLQLEAALRALIDTSAVAEISDRRVLALVYCLQVRKLLADSKVDEAKQAIHSAKTEFRLAKTEPYSGVMLSLVENLEIGYAAVFALASYQQAADLLASHQFEDAEQMLETRLKSNPDNAEEIKVLLELCTCGSTLCDTLERLMGDSYEKGMSPQRFRELNKEKKFVNNLREMEFCALLHLLRRDYKTAFAENPYASKPDSNEPFAVMMRDWKTRLAPYIKE